ncbi:hypothetical protein ETD86_49420 [Nonomuraea turkmeniaca]|uniref:Uncharacterized protein n=1 Tax=Nonomuraea turkmeniaca TaxID=103838 RepID=A0A5S4EX33_9ACTN|nr:hypothetical protein [Nonomuraea turkmeniaca]TMR08057.1 hypothetical protein ETD86_49420 [Nonomuraea turkmeniaca]
MRNGVRHVLGAGAGLVATPLIAAGVAYGLNRPQPIVDRIALAALFGAVIVVGVLAGSRVSPLGSLLPGLAFMGLWVTAQVRLGMGGDHKLWYEFVPAEYLQGYESFLHTWSPVVGCILLTASVFPSRWRAAAEPVAPPPEEEAAVPEPPPLPKRIPSRY